MRILLALLVAASLARSAETIDLIGERLPAADKAEILEVGSRYLTAVSESRIDDAIALVVGPLREAVREALTGMRYELPVDPDYALDVAEDGIAAVTILNTSYGAEVTKVDGHWRVTSRALADKLKSSAKP